MPATKKMRPRILHITTALISWAPPLLFMNNTAAQIKPPMPRTVSNPPKIFLIFISAYKYCRYKIKCILNAYITQVMENPEYFQKPYNNEDYHHNIQNGFNLFIHRDVRINEPQNNSCGNENE